MYEYCLYVVDCNVAPETESLLPSSGDGKIDGALKASSPSVGEGVAEQTSKFQMCILTTGLKQKAQHMLTLMKRQR